MRSGDRETCRDCYLLDFCRYLPTDKRGKLHEQKEAPGGGE